MSEQICTNCFKPCKSIQDFIDLPKTFATPNSGRQMLEDCFSECCGHDVCSSEEEMDRLSDSLAIGEEQ